MIVAWHVSTRYVGNSPFNRTTMESPNTGAWVAGVGATDYATELRAISPHTKTRNPSLPGITTQSECPFFPMPSFLQLLELEGRRNVSPVNETACGHKSYGRSCSKTQIAFQPETKFHNSLLHRTFRITITSSRFCSFLSIWKQGVYARGEGWHDEESARVSRRRVKELPVRI